jgi:hypothetical protein
MSEKRKPEIVLFAEIHGNGTRKRFKVELFPASLWVEVPRSRISIRRNSGDTYRLRVSGKWYRGIETFTFSQVMTLLRRSLVDKRNSNRSKASAATTESKGE